MTAGQPAQIFRLQMAAPQSISIQSEAELAAKDSTFLFDQVIAIEAVDVTPGSYATFRGTLPTKFTTLTGTVSGGVLVAIVIRALCEAQKGTTKPDIKHIDVDFPSSARKGDFIIEIQIGKVTNQMTFLEGVMRGNGPLDEPLVRFRSIFGRFNGGDKLAESIIHAPDKTKIKGQRTTSLYSVAESQTLGRIGQDGSQLLPWTEAIPKTSLESVFCGRDSFKSIIDMRIDAETATAFKDQLAGKLQGDWADRAVAVYAGCPDLRPVDAAFLGLISEAPNYSNTLSPFAKLDLSQPLVLAMLSCSLDFYGAIPETPYVLFRNRLECLAGDGAGMNSMAWCKDTGKLLMTGHCFAYVSLAAAGGAKAAKSDKNRL